MAAEILGNARECQERVGLIDAPWNAKARPSLAFFACFAAPAFDRCVRNSAWRILQEPRTPWERLRS